MHRRFPLMLRISLALLLTLIVPLCTLAALSYSLQKSIRLETEQRIETTLDMAIQMEEGLIREGLVDMRDAAAAAAIDPGVGAALADGRLVVALSRFQSAFPRADMLVLVDRQGIVRARATSNRTGDQVLLNGLVAYALSAGEPQAYPSLISPGELAGEGTAVQQLVDMLILKTGGSTDPRAGSRVESALALAGVAPVRGADGEVLGAVIAADILNRDFRIVDEVARWAPEGIPMNATIAMGGVRVTTNVRLRDEEGNPSEHRALGTVYSDAVMQSLATNGVHRGRATVVGQWQRTIYKALNDYQGRMIAAPYVGIPEAYFATVGQKFTQSLQTAVAIGSGALAVSLVFGLMLLFQGTVGPLRRLAAQLKGGPVSTYAHDEIGDVAAAALANADRLQHALAETDRLADALNDSLGALMVGPAGGAVSVVRAPGVAVGDLRAGAAGALEHLHQLSQALRHVAEGVRSEERSMHYVGRVAQEIATGLEEARPTMEAALDDVAKLTASARAALKQSGEFAAGLALARQSMHGNHAALELLRDPSDQLGALLALSDRVAGQVRTLVLTMQENQARLAFIREEMTRVGYVVQTTASATQAATQSAGVAIGWMEGMTGNVIAIADEVLAARTAFGQAEAAHQALRSWCDQVERHVTEFRRAVATLRDAAQ